MILRFQFFLAELIVTCSIIGSSVYFDRTIVKLSCFLLYIARNSYQKKIKVLSFNLKSVLIIRVRISGKEWLFVWKFWVRTKWMIPSPDFHDSSEVCVVSFIHSSVACNTVVLSVIMKNSIKDLLSFSLLACFTSDFS